MAHITGGGIAGNLVRILPHDCAATVDPDTWELPPLFSTLQQAGQISTQEMRDVFNLGVGLVAVLPPDAVTAAQAAASADGVTSWVMGEIQRGSRSVRFARP
jgi:phosphoribosylformylglycinamidine cyclo-ligase